MMISSHTSSFHFHVLRGPRNSITSPTPLECNHRPTSPCGYRLIQNVNRPLSSGRKRGVYGLSTWISSSLMNTDQMGLSAGEFRGGNRYGWTDTVINFVFGPVGSLDQMTAGVKWEADIGWPESSNDLNMKYAAAVHRPNAPDRKITRLRNCNGLCEVHLLAVPRHGWRDAHNCGCGLVDDRICRGCSQTQPNNLDCLKKANRPFPSFVCYHQHSPARLLRRRARHSRTHEHISITITFFYFTV